MTASASNPGATTSHDADVVIIGGGVIGLTTAIALLDAGRSVTVLERTRTGCGSSHGNCGTITPSHAGPLAAPGMIAMALRWLFTPDAPLHIKPRLDPALLRWLLDFARRCNAEDYTRALLAKLPLLMRSRDLVEALILREGMASEFEATGALDVYRDPQQFATAQAHVDELTGVGFRVDLLDAGQTLAREPSLKADTVGSCYYADDAQLKPDRHMAELARVVSAKGGMIVEQAEAQGFIRSGNQIERVASTAGEYRARDVVFALGAWSPMLARTLGLRLPIQPGKGYSITYRRPQIAPRIPMTLHERKVCVTAWQEGFRIGSTMEFAGYDESLNKVRLDALRRAAREYLVDPVGPEQIEEWFGWRPMTSDDLPFIGRAPGIENLVIATGHGMLGMTMSAGTAELVTELITGRPLSLDIVAFDPARFA